MYKYIIELESLLIYIYIYICTGLQIFPLLMEHISVKEQTSLVWQFLCSVPIVLMEDMLPWTLSFLSPQERVEFTNCIKEIVPEEKSLQEVTVVHQNPFNY